MNDYLETLLSGRPVSGLHIVDSHDHLGPWSNFRVSQRGSIESLVRRCDQIGIDRVTLTAHASIGPDMRRGNDLVLDAVTRFPQRAAGYVTVKPCGEEEMLEELRFFFGKRGFVGVKLHPDLHGRQVADPVYDPAYAFADARRLPVLIHTWGARNVLDIDALAARYKNASFIVAHLGGAPDALDTALQTIARRDNVFGDTALSAAPMGNIDYAISKIGAEKLLFGTDMPFYDPCFTLARVLAAGLTQRELQCVLGGNFTRLCARSSASCTEAGTCPSLS